MCAIICQYHTDAVNLELPAVISRAMAALAADPGLIANYNTWLGMEAYVLLGYPKADYERMTFGLTPPWAIKKMLLFNARAEGKLNSDNDPAYQGQAGIFNMPAFRHSIQYRRCVVPVNAFVEGTEKGKLSEPFLIKAKNRNLFFLGGIWEEWTDKETGEITRGFAIITTAASPLLQTLPHHRSPLILKDNDIHKWLDPSTIPSEISMLMKPFNSSGYTAYPISSSIKSRANQAELLQPVTSP